MKSLIFPAEHADNKNKPALHARADQFHCQPSLMMEDVETMMVREANVAVAYPEFTDAIEIEFDDELCGVPAWECAHPFLLLDKTVPANVLLLPDMPFTARNLPTWLTRLLKDYEYWTLDSKSTVRLVLALVTIVLFIAAMWA